MRSEQKSPPTNLYQRVRNPVLTVPGLLWFPWFNQWYCESLPPPPLLVWVQLLISSIHECWPQLQPMWSPQHLLMCSHQGTVWQSYMRFSMSVSESRNPYIKCRTLEHLGGFVTLCRGSLVSQSNEWIIVSQSCWNRFPPCQISIAGCVALPSSWEMEKSGGE